LLRPGGPGIREDEGVYEGWEVPTEYDPMLSKLIACAPDRATAIARLGCAIDEYAIGGIQTNLKLLRRVLDDADFQAARIDTGYLDRLLAKTVPQSVEADKESQEAAAIAAVLLTAPIATVAAAKAPTLWQRDALEQGLRR
jgi:acetyl-CoA carboxylase biotin carboxylase subunit